MQFEFIESNKGGDMIIANDFLFRYKTKNGNTKYFRCIDCNSSIIFDTSTNSVRHTQSGVYPNHDHQNHLKLINEKRVINAAKSNIQLDLKETVRSSFNKAIRSNNASLDGVKTFIEKKSALLKFKKRQLPNQPQNRADLVIPNEYSITITGEPFLSINDGNDKLLHHFNSF